MLCGDVYELPPGVSPLHLMREVQGVQGQPGFLSRGMGQGERECEEMSCLRVHDREDRWLQSYRVQVWKTCLLGLFGILQQQRRLL